MNNVSDDVNIDNKNNQDKALELIEQWLRELEKESEGK